MIFNSNIISKTFKNLIILHLKMVPLFDFLDDYLEYFEKFVLLIFQLYCNITLTLLDQMKINLILLMLKVVAIVQMINQLLFEDHVYKETLSFENSYKKF